MRKRFLLLIPMVALAATPFLCMKDAVPTFAEEEISSSVVPEEPSEGEGDTSKPKIDDIVIDGKTIAQWKAELKDENTRMVAIFSIAFIAFEGVMFALKWASERGLLKKNLAQGTKLEDSGAKLEGLLGKNEKDAAEAVKKLQEDIEAMHKLYEGKAKEEAAIISMFESIMKTDPNLVAQNTYAKYEESLKALKEGYGKEE